MSGSFSPDAKPAQDTLPTAEIIPFPGRAQSPAAKPEDRLARAVESLNAAMAEQKTALAAWRGALGALQASTNGLGDSLKRYQHNLGSLGGQVAALRDQAITMERWADGVLSK